MINLLMYWMVHHTDLLLWRNIPWSEASCLFGCNSIGGFPPQLFWMPPQLHRWLGCFPALGCDHKHPVKSCKLVCTALVYVHGTLYVIFICMFSRWRCHHNLVTVVAIWLRFEEIITSSLQNLANFSPVLHRHTRSCQEQTIKWCFLKRPVLVSLFNLTQF